MPRAAFLQRLEPGKTEEYVEAHESVPRAVEETMAEAGVEWFDLYVREEVAVCVLSVADPAEYERVYGRAIEESETVAEWERLSSSFKESGIDDGAGIPWMERAWTAEFD